MIEKRVNPIPISTFKPKWETINIQNEMWNRDPLTTTNVPYIGKIICSRDDIHPMSTMQLEARLASEWSNIASNS